MKFRLGWYLNFEDDLLTCYLRNSGNTWLCWCGPWAHGGWWRGSWAFPPLRHRPLPASYRPLPSEHPVGSQSIQSFKFNLTSEWIEKQNSDHLALLDESQELLLEGCSLWIVFGWHDDPASVFYSDGKKADKMKETSAPGRVGQVTRVPSTQCWLYNKKSFDFFLMRKSNWPLVRSCTSAEQIQ